MLAVLSRYIASGWVSGTHSTIKEWFQDCMEMWLIKEESLARPNLHYECLLQIIRNSVAFDMVKIDQIERVTRMINKIGKGQSEKSTLMILLGAIIHSSKS